MFQPDKITRLAVVVFKEEGQIKISGQGKLKKVFLSAYLSEDGLQIQPPREHFYFNKNSYVDIDQALVHKLATYFILTEQEAEEQVRSWENTILHLARAKGLPFGDFGAFYYDEQLDFVSDSLFYYQCLPVLPFQSAGTYLRDYPLIEGTKVLPGKGGSSRKKKRILIPALWSLLLCLFAFALFFWWEPLNLMVNQNAHLNSRLVNVAPESYSTNSSSEYYSDTHEVETTDLALRKNNPLHSENHKSDYEVQLLPPSDIIEPSFTKQEPPSPDVRNSEVLDTSELKTEDTPGCTLIVGAFADPGNVDRMVTRLNGFDVKVVTLERKTLTLVGAQIQCSDQSKITLLKNKIEPNAWFYNN